ncbi:MAG: sensor histidine kinase [Chloroflexota bacterium]
MSTSTKLDLQTVLDGLGQGVLIFGSDGRLILDNLAARSMLGTDINLIRANGWDAATALFNARQTNPDQMVEAYRDQALQSERPIHFTVFRSGEHVPCWAAAVLANDGEVCTMITLDAPDWTALRDLMGRFKEELGEAIRSTQGHIDIINQTMVHHTGAEGNQLTKRVTGFTQLIAIHMDRTSRLLDMLTRLEKVRTGTIKEELRGERRRVLLEDYMEDFVEELDEINLVDPETDAHDHRSRLSIDVMPGLAVHTSAAYLTQILRDILRNAIMYSMKATSITIRAYAKNQQVQIDVIDQGYGIRERERERVFVLFQRARQPQIIGEFGYGLSLYLCKHEVEAMNGRIWFESEEGVGTTFSMMLPAWREAESSSSSDTQTASTG